MGYENRNWCFTWCTNKDQKKLPTIQQLQRFFDYNCTTAVMQLEKGEKAGKEHFQGRFTLKGPRLTKKKLLEIFKERLKNISGLTLSQEFDSIASNSYVTKVKTRIDGPWYFGSEEMYNAEIAAANLRPWQQQLYNHLTRVRNMSKEHAVAKEINDRTIYWVRDTRGCTGKSFFQKWLKTGQKTLVCNKLPVSSVDRLLSAVCKINKKNVPDVYMINLTRTQGEDQSYKDLFAAVEDIKDGYIVDVMYGNYNESIFDPPLIVIFSNFELNEFAKYLSVDRWQELGITHGGNLQFRGHTEAIEKQLFYCEELKSKYKKMKSQFQDQDYTDSETENGIQELLDQSIDTIDYT